MLALIESERNGTKTVKKHKGDKVKNKNAVFKMRLVKKLDKVKKKAFI